MTGLPYETIRHKGALWTKKPAIRWENWTVGYDPGQSVDAPALCVLRYTRVPLTGEDSWIVRKDINVMTQRVNQRYDILDIKRLPQGMLYQDQVVYIQQALARMRHSCDLAIDDTGHRGGVADLCQELGLRPVRIAFTGGAEVTRGNKPRSYNVPKGTLIGNIDTALNAGELHIAGDLAEGEALTDELANIERYTTGANRFGYEARAGKHDDLVAALAVAMFWSIEARILKKPIMGITTGLY